MQRKYLISDFDHTLYYSDQIDQLKEDIQSITAWREQGNCFVIATGRYYRSIKKMMDLFSIPYDYLITSDGQEIYDNQDQLLFSTSFGENELLFLTHQLEENETKEWYYVTNEGLTQEKSGNVLASAISFQGLEKTEEQLHVYEELFPNTFCYFSPNWLNVLPQHANKKEGIQHLQALLGIQQEDIIVVGDNKNDIEMLENYRGYKMKESKPILDSLPLPIVESISEVIDIETT